MTISRAQISIAASVLALGTAAFVVLSNEAASRRAMLDNLLKQKDQVAVLRAENSRLAENAAKVQSQRAQVAELEQLRLELASLQAQLKAATHQNTEAPPQTSTEPPFAGPFFERNQVDVRPTVKFRARPVVPPEVRALGITNARTTLDYIVDENGKVRNLTVLSTTVPVIGESEAAAVRASEFAPAQKDGHAVAVHMRQTSSFATATLVPVAGETPPTTAKLPTLVPVPWF